MKTKLGRPAKWRNRTVAMRLPEFMKDMLLELSKIGDDEGYETVPGKGILYKKGGTLEKVAEVLENKTGYFVQKSANKKPKREKKERDKRLDHPAIIAIYAVMERYPSKKVWDEIIERIGDTPDIDRMTVAFAAWCRVSQNAFNLAVWLFDWYINGIPNGNGKGRPVLTNEQLLASHEETVRRLQGG